MIYRVGCCSACPRLALALLDDAINFNKIDELRSLWDYIKGCRRSIRHNLTVQEQQLIDTFILDMRQKMVFILSKGDLEAYLPEGYKTKQLDKLIRLVDTDFWPQLPSFAQIGLKDITEKIKKL